MKTIVNKTRKPLKIHLPGGKVLHLGPGKTGQISDHAAEDAAIQRLLKSREIQIAGEGPAESSVPGQEGPAHESTQGHRQTVVVHPKGNR